MEMYVDDEQMLNSVMAILLQNDGVQESALPDFDQLTPLGGMDPVYGQTTPSSQYQQLTPMSAYDSAPSPPLSTISTSSNSHFSFPTPAPTPEAALPLAESLEESPNIDISIYGSPIQDMVFGQQTTNLQGAPTAGQDTGSIVKKELATRIRERRRASGLGELSLEDEENTDENKNELTPQDKVRKERRKASNRRAATKCRIKKKAIEEETKLTMDALREENARLRADLDQLNTSRQQLQEQYEQHKVVCPLLQR